MVYHDESENITDSENGDNLSCLQAKSTLLTSKCYNSSCSYCDMNFLKTIRSEIKQLTDETELLKYSSKDYTNHCLSSDLPFETQRLHFYAIIDEWKSDRIDHIGFIYQKKKNQIDLICSQTFREYEIFKVEQKSFYNDILLNNNHNQRTVISNEIDELHKKLSLTRNLLDYFIQPKSSNQNIFFEKICDNETESINYDEVFKNKPISEYTLSTDNLAMACSNSHILLRDDTRLLLFNEKEKIHQLDIKIQNSGDFIRDLCWCETLGYYLVLTQYLLFSYDPQKYVLNVIENVKPIEQLKFSSITCSDNIMFLVNGNGQFIERWSIAKSFHWKLIKRWSENEFCRENFRLTSRIRANHLMLALNICDRNFGYCICFYDYQMRFLRRINSDFSLHLLSYMNGNQWIATDYKERLYIFNNNDDTVKSVIDYNGKGGYIRNICRLGSNHMVVKIMNRLQIYKI